MKLAIELKCDSPQAWLDCVMANFDEFLQDHADCERKASSMAMSFVAKYPDRKEIIPELKSKFFEKYKKSHLCETLLNTIFKVQNYIALEKIQII